jgi:hypothetical protein
MTRCWWRQETPPGGRSRRCVRIWKSRLMGQWGFWLWECSFCDPPCRGYRTQQGAMAKIIAVSLPRHFRRRAQHHAHVGKKPL